MHTAVDLLGVHSIQVEELSTDLPGGTRAGTIILIARNAANTITIALPRDVALSLHQGLDPWARAIHQENDHGPSPSVN